VNAREQLDNLEARMANDDDRNVEEYRERHPDNVAVIEAVRAVLDLHKPDTDGDCRACGLSSDEESFPYPCDTANAISAALAQ
jgi:hypothetical protein